MIKSIEMFTIVCDNCKKDLCSGHEYSAWGHAGYVEEMADEDNWHKEDDKHYCPDCYSWDDDDNLVLKMIEK